MTATAAQMYSKGMPPKLDPGVGVGVTTNVGVAVPADEGDVVGEVVGAEVCVAVGVSEGEGALFTVTVTILVASEVPIASVTFR